NTRSSSCPTFGRPASLSPRDQLPHRTTLHRPATFSATFVALPGVDGIKSFRMLLKVALRRFGLRAIDVRELPPNPQPREPQMSAFSHRVRANRTRLFKVADFDGGKEQTFTISLLDEAMEMFGKTGDLLNFKETGQQLQLNLTTAEWLLDNFGDDP